MIPTIFPTAAAFACAVAALGWARRGRPALWPALVLTDGAIVFSWPLVAAWWPAGAPLFAVCRWALIPLGLLAIGAALTLSRWTRRSSAAVKLAAFVACPFAGWAISPAPFYLDAVLCYLPLAGAAWCAWPRRFQPCP